MVDATFTDQNFDSDVLKADKPVLVDFWAVWCSPCLLQGPIVEEIAKDLHGKATIGKFNVDENPQISQQFNIMSIPTIMIFNKGQLVRQFVGVQSKQTLMGELNKILN